MVVRTCSRAGESFLPTEISRGKWKNSFKDEETCFCAGEYEENFI